MTQRYLQPNNNNTQWFVRTNTIIGNSNENINFSPSVDSSFNQGVVFNYSSFLQIPVGPSNERPVTNEIGMIRYDTNRDVIEHYNGQSSSWLPISQPPPSITSFSPLFITEPSGSQTQTIDILGNNFISASTVKFVSSTAPFDEFSATSTTYINNNNIIANLDPSNTIFDNSNTSPWFIEVNNFGLTGTSTSTLYWNDRPIFTNPVNLGTVTSDSSVINQLTDLSGIDPDNHYPLKFDLCGSTLPGSIILLPSGDFSGNAPIVSTGVSTYTPNFIITDSALNKSFPKVHQFSVASENSFTVTSVTNGSYHIVYTNSSGVEISNPEYTGYTVYIFKNTSSVSSSVTNASFTITPNNPLSSLTYLCVGGGGGGGSSPDFGSTNAGGGGAGGLLTNTNLGFSSSTSYSIQVGGGGQGNKSATTNGPGDDGGNCIINNSSSVITSIGGGGGGGGQPPDGNLPPPYEGNGRNGGSGGGASGTSTSATGGSGTSGQGNDGGDSSGSGESGASGGGAGGVGSQIGTGGIGLTNTIVSTTIASAYSVGDVNSGAVYYAGGGGCSSGGVGTVGGLGGGGQGASHTTSNSPTIGQPGTANTGGGGGAGSYQNIGGGDPYNAVGGDGGNGIIIIKIPSYFS